MCTCAQLTCGSELGCMLVDAYTQDGCQAGQAETERITSILMAFSHGPPHAEPADAETSFSEASRVGSTAIRWARKQVGACAAARHQPTCLALNCESPVMGMLAVDIIRAYACAGQQRCCQAVP